jgi:hypothetical protein
VLGSPGVELHVRLEHERHAGVDLVGAVHDHLGRPAGVPLRQRNLAAGRQALIEPPRRLPHEQIREMGGDGDVGAQVLHGLELPDGPAELRALVGVVDGEVEQLLAGADDLGAPQHAGPVQRGGEQLPALIDAAHHRLRPQLDVERQREQRHAGDVRQRLDRHAAARFDKEKGHAVGRRRRAGGHEELRSDVGVRHEELRAPQGEAVEGPAGRQRDGVGSPRPVGLEQRGCHDGRPGDDRR